MAVSIWKKQTNLPKSECLVLFTMVPRAWSRADANECFLSKGMSNGILYLNKLQKVKVEKNLPDQRVNYNKRPSSSCENSQPGTSEDRGPPLLMEGWAG
jgi:hypothetical protein